MGESWKWQLRDSEGLWIEMGARVSWLERGLMRFGQVVGSPKAGYAEVRQDGRPTTQNVLSSRIHVALPEEPLLPGVPSVPIPRPSAGRSIVPRSGLLAGPAGEEYFDRRYGDHFDRLANQAAKRQVAEKVGALMTDITMNDLAAMGNEYPTTTLVSNAMASSNPDNLWLVPDGQNQNRKWLLRSIKPPARPAVENSIHWGTPEAERAMRVSIAADITDGWAITSTDERPQKAAEQVFGITGASNVRKTRTHHDLSPEGASQKVHRSYQRAAAALTQAQLRGDGIKKVRLYRGTAKKYPAGRQKTALRPLTAWTVSRDVADDFADGGSVFVLDVPIDRIVSMPGTGMGCLDEYEAVISGGPTELDVQPWSPPLGVLLSEQVL